MKHPASYTLGSYGDMIAEPGRFEPYRQALGQAVRPGCVVVDLGAGTGIFALLACQLGAGHVHAIEPDDAIEVARITARVNGLSDRITFHQALSTEVTLPSPADVIISDLRGVLPLLQEHVPTLVDARTRLLAPGGALIPRRDVIQVAPVESPATYRRFEVPWQKNDLGLDLSAGQARVVNAWQKTRGEPAWMLAPAQTWATLDYHTRVNPNVTGDLTFVVEREGTAHGWLVWFDADLAEGFGFSNAPGQPELLYGQAFFPLERATPVTAGDRLDLRMAANLVSGEYVWRWTTAVAAGDAPDRPRARFEQSTFLGAPLPLERLRRRAATHVPAPTRDAEVDGFILAQVDGLSALGAIAERVRARFPDRFERFEAALDRVGELLERYRT